MPRESDSEDKHTSLPRIPSTQNTSKYDSPFAIPDDAEVAVSRNRSFV
jgi:hypothetical protein